MAWTSSNLHRGQTVDVDLDAPRLGQGEGVVRLAPGPAPGEHGVAFGEDHLPGQGMLDFR